MNDKLFNPGSNHAENITGTDTITYTGIGTTFKTHTENI